MTQGYFALARPSEYVFEQKRSTFTALLYPVTSREEAMEQLRLTRERYPGASHYCWAYIIGDAHQPHNAAFSDDGEPSGTAGKPMLSVLTHRRAGDCLAVVVRTFGGVKLGAGGLVRAYGAAVSGALDGAHWREVLPQQAVRIRCDFADEQKVRLVLGGRGIDIEQVAYSSCVDLRAEVVSEQVAELGEQITELTSGRARLKCMPQSER